MTDQELNKLYDAVLDKVIEQIKTDINNGDVTALEELLSRVPTQSLVTYLPEHEWKQFKSFLK